MKKIIPLLFGIGLAVPVSMALSNNASALDACINIDDATSTITMTNCDVEGFSLTGLGDDLTIKIVGKNTISGVMGVPDGDLTIMGEDPDVDSLEMKYVNLSSPSLSSAITVSNGSLTMKNLSLISNGSKYQPGAFVGRDGVTLDNLKVNFVDISSGSYDNYPFPDPYTYVSYAIFTVVEGDMTVTNVDAFIKSAGYGYIFRTSKRDCNIYIKDSNFEIDGSEGLLFQQGRKDVVMDGVTVKTTDGSMMYSLIHLYAYSNISILDSEINGSFLRGFIFGQDSGGTIFDVQDSTINATIVEGGSFWTATVLGIKYGVNTNFVNSVINFNAIDAAGVSGIQIIAGEINIDDSDVTIALNGGYGILLEFDGVLNLNSGTLNIDGGEYGILVAQLTDDSSKKDASIVNLNSDFEINATESVFMEFVDVDPTEYSYSFGENMVLDNEFVLERNDLVVDSNTPFFYTYIYNDNYLDFYYISANDSDSNPLTHLKGVYTAPEPEPEPEPESEPDPAILVPNTGVETKSNNSGANADSAIAILVAFYTILAYGGYVLLKK